MFILTSLFFYCSTAKADDCDSNVIELYDYETGQTSNISISDYSINFLPASGIIMIQRRKPRPFAGTSEG